MTAVPEALGHKVGPLPLAGWIGIIGGAYVISTYARRKTTPAAVGQVLDGTAAQNLAPTGTPATSGPTTNAEWMQLAEKELINNHGYDPADVDDALRRYIAGTDLRDIGEQLIVTAALRFEGPLPQPLPPTQSGPIHVPARQPVPGPPGQPPYLPPIPTPALLPAPMAPIVMPPQPAPAPSPPVNDITKAPPEWQNVPPGWYDSIGKQLWW